MTETAALVITAVIVAWSVPTALADTRAWRAYRVRRARKRRRKRARARARARQMMGAGRG